MEAAHAAMVEEDYGRAVELYTAHLATLEAGNDDAGGDEAKAVCLASRAAAHLKLRGQEAAALADAKRAGQLKPDYEVAFYRQGVAAFGLGRFAEAKASLEKGLALRGGEDVETRRYASWLRKCELELAEQEQEQEEKQQQAPQQQPQQEAERPSPTSTGSTAASSSSTSSSLSSLPPRYQYYQSGTHVTVTLLQKGVKEEEADVAIQPRRLTVKAGGAVLFDKPLFDAVEPAESQAKFFNTKVEIMLKKASAHQWADLTASTASTTASTASTSAAPVPAAVPATAAAAPLPTAAAPEAGKKAPRPYASHKDWEAVEREITKELEGEKPEGEEALNKLFQDIYKNASDDTRRAMVKSFQTSGGTVLSTNWDEVAKKDYEADRPAPEGMEWRKWG